MIHEYLEVAAIGVFGGVALSAIIWLIGYGISMSLSLFSKISLGKS